MDVVTRHHQGTGTLTHLVCEGADAVLIDPVLEFDAVTGTTSTAALEAWASMVEVRGLTVHAVLETHVHADHLSGARWWAARFGTPIFIGHRIREVQATLRTEIGREDLVADGRHFDRLLHDGEVLQFGALSARVLETPGHTPACVSYVIQDAVFTGDALCNPDNGVGRCDFPGADAGALYEAITSKLYALPPDTRVFPGHDYPVAGRAVRHWASVAEQRAANVQLRDGVARDAFVTARHSRDATLSPPKLLWQSLRANIDAGAR